MKHLDALEREIRSAHGTVVNGIDNRRNHPTFGYTKAGITADLNVLRGLLVAHRIITGQAPGNPSAFIGDYAKEAFGIDLLALERRIKAS